MSCVQSVAPYAQAVERIMASAMGNACFKLNLPAAMANVEDRSTTFPYRC